MVPADTDTAAEYHLVKWIGKSRSVLSLWKHPEAFHCVATISDAKRCPPVPLISGHSDFGNSEVSIVQRRAVDKVTVKQFAVRSTKASAKLERREVPAGFVRSAKAEQFLKQRQSRG